MTSVNITLDDPNNDLEALPLLGPTIRAAIAYLERYVVFNGTIDVEVAVETTSTGRFAGGGDIVLAGQQGGRNTYEAAMLVESRTGVDPHPAVADFTIYIDPNSDYVSGLWWDPNIATGVGANPPNTRTDAFSVVLHEILHGMGVTGWRNIATGALPAGIQSVWDSLVTVSGGLASFTGASTIDLIGSPVEVRLGGSQGAFHLGNGPTLSASEQPWLESSNLNGYYFYFGERYLLGRIELAILEDLGWTLKPTTLVSVVNIWNDRPTPLYLIGWETDEVLTGGTLADRLEGRGGNDTLLGKAGNDKLFGGAGSDHLTGGAGRDILVGDSGAGVRDVFDFNAVTESGKTAGTRDVIIGFEHLFDDIDLSTIDASTKTGGNQAFKFIGTQKFHKVAGELHVISSGGNKIIEGDTNGDGKADFQIQVNGNIAISAGDFIL